MRSTPDHEQPFAVPQDAAARGKERPRIEEPRQQGGPRPPREQEARMAANLPKPVTVRVDAGTKLGTLPHNWTYIGYDEINYTYTPEGQELLAKFMALR